MEENWRNYLRNANGDIFEIINQAIRVAASDYPLEFHYNKHKIAETLYSCPSLINCKKMDVVREEQANDDHGSSKIKSPPTDETQIIPTSTKQQQRSNVIRIKLKKKAQDQTTDEDSLYRKRIAEILRIKGVLDNSTQGESESVVVCELLTKLQYMGLGLDVLEATGIGKTVNALQTHASKDVNQIAKTLMKQWKAMVNERFEKNSSVVKPASEQQLVLNPTSLNTEKKIQPDSEKANNKQGPLTFDRHLKPMDSKAATKNQKGEDSIIEDKFEAAKRKLQHNYQEAENMKKQRRIHVIEFHELSRHGLLPQQQQRQLKSRNDQFKRRGNVNSRIHRLVSTY